MVCSCRLARCAAKSTSSRSKTCSPARSSRKLRARGVPGSAEVVLRRGFVPSLLRAAAAAAAWALAVFVGDVLRGRRAHAEAAMARAGITDPGRTVRAMYRSLARGLVELLTLAFSAPGKRLSRSFPWAAIHALSAG